MLWENHLRIESAFTTCFAPKRTLGGAGGTFDYCNAYDLGAYRS